MAEKEKSKLIPDGHGGYVRTDLNEGKGEEGGGGEKTLAKPAKVRSPRLKSEQVEKKVKTAKNGSSIPVGQVASPSGNVEYEFDVFLSYSSLDKSAVTKLAERLKKDGLRVWFDRWVIKPGDSIFLSIQKGLNNSRVMVLVLSRHTTGAAWPEMEQGTAIFRDPTNKKRRFIPLRLDDSKIPDVLNQYKFVDYRHEDETEYKQLLESCRPDQRFTRNGRNDDQGSQRQCEKFRRDIVSVLNRESSVVTKLVAELGKESVVVSGGDAKKLMEILVGLPYESVSNILLRIYDNCVEKKDIPGQRVIEKISRMLLPLLYVEKSENCAGLKEKWEEMVFLEDQVQIPAGIASTAEMIMAGLNCREVLWKATRDEKNERRIYPDGFYGFFLNDLPMSPENGWRENVMDQVRRDIYSKIEVPLGTAKETLEEQDKAINEQLEFMVKNGKQLYHVYYDNQTSSADGQMFKEVLDKIKGTYPYMGIIELNREYRVRDMRLFQEIGHLIVTEGQ